MLTGKNNILFVQYGNIPPINHIPLKPGAGFYAALIGKIPGGAVALKFFCNGIVRIDNQNIPIPLIAKQVSFGIGILLHILVDIQMVGCQIGNHRNVGALVHIHQLERAQLHNGVVVLLDFIN